MLGSERGYRRAAAAAEKRPDHLSGLHTDTASEVCGPEPGGESYLQASPDVRYREADRVAFVRGKTHITTMRYLSMTASLRPGRTERPLLARILLLSEV